LVSTLTGGGEHFSFFNQPIAAEANYYMFWKAVRLLTEDAEALEQFDQVGRGFSEAMQKTNPKNVGGQTWLD